MSVFKCLYLGSTMYVKIKLNLKINPVLVYFIVKNYTNKNHTTLLNQIWNGQWWKITNIIKSLIIKQSK